jgi:hypothetical protein
MCRGAELKVQISFSQWPSRTLFGAQPGTHSRVRKSSISILNRIFGQEAARGNRGRAYVGAVVSG